VTREKRIRFLIQELNDDLARKLGGVLRCTYQAAKAMAGGSKELGRMLRSEAAEELRDAGQLAEAIVRLGGEPTTTPVDFDKPCGPKMMIEMDVLMERGEAQRFLEHARIARELEDTELQARLEAIAAAHASRARDLTRVLHATWPPTVQRPN
jgi:bacterioferritin (cytochrome b1)